MISPDVVVVGARCAGAATALLLARAGHDVLLLDRSQRGTDTLSTHGVSPGGVVQLARLGVLDDVLASGAPRVREIAVHVEGVERRLPVPATRAADFVLAPRRFILDRILVDAAERAGARVSYGVNVVGLKREVGGPVTGVVAESAGRTVEIDARFVVGADGLRSRVARHAGADIVTWVESRAAIFYAYVSAPDWGPFEFHVGRRSLAGVFPTHGGEACVWLWHDADDAWHLTSGQDRTEGFLHRLGEEFPELAGRLRRGRVTSPVRGAVRLPNMQRAAVGSGWALVGDAGYHRDPVTGHGITDALRDAELLAKSLDGWLHGDLAESELRRAYQDVRDEMGSRIFDLTRDVCDAADPRRWLQVQRDLGEAIAYEANWLQGQPFLNVPERGAA